MSDSEQAEMDGDRQRHGPASLTATLMRLLEERIDARPLAVTRVLIGLAALARASEAGRIFARLSLPTTIRLPYVPWVPAIQDALLGWLLGVWILAAIAFACGWRTRLAGTILASVLFYVVLLDEQTYSNHLYLLALVTVLLSLANAGAAWSIDAWLTDARADAAQAWAVFLLRTQVSAVYAFAGLSKINAAYLGGATMTAYVSPDLLAALPDAARTPLVLLASWGSIVIELGLAVALWLPRWWAGAVACGVALHAGMVALLPPGVRFQLAIFALEMFALYLVFRGNLPLRIRS